MSAPTTAAAASGERRAYKRVPLAPAASRDAKKVAAAILEVLAGARTPPQAAEALGLSLPRYYQLETRALRGLLAACEPQPRGRPGDAAGEAAGLRREVERLRRELGRQQSLARLAQRAVGLTPPAAPKKAEKKKGRRRRRTARALSLAGRLRQEAEAEAAPAVSDNRLSATPP